MRFPRPCGACRALVGPEGCSHWKPGSGVRRVRNGSPLVRREKRPAMDPNDPEVVERQMRLLGLTAGQDAR